MKLSSKIILTCIVITIGYWFMHYAESFTKKNEIILAEMIDMKSDSIIMLKELLETELKNHCDTMTADERYKLAQLEKYSQEIFKEFQEYKTQAFIDKEDANFKAFKEKENASFKCFNDYHRKKAKKFEEWVIRDPESFNEYVMKTFWSSYDYCLDNENEIDYFKVSRRAESLISDFENWDMIEYQTYKDSDRAFSQKYEKTKQINNEMLKVTELAWEEKYKQKIEAKRKELGL